MTAEIDMLDIMNNPFIDWSSHGVQVVPETWDTDHEACASVLQVLRDNIARCEFKLAHPPMMYSESQRRAFSDRMYDGIAYWTSRLAEARYN